MGHDIEGLYANSTANSPDLLSRPDYIAPHNIYHHVWLITLGVDRHPQAILRLPDGFNNDELCQCNRVVGEDILNLAA